MACGKLKDCCFPCFLCMMGNCFNRNQDDNVSIISQIEHDSAGIGENRSSSLFSDPPFEVFILLKCEYYIF